MGRIFVHYDISDDEARTSFQLAITGKNHDPVFHEVTESAYVAVMKTTPTNLAALEKRLRDHFSAQPPPGTRVFLDWAATTNGAPDIVQETIVDTPASPP